MSEGDVNTVAEILPCPWSVVGSKERHNLTVEGLTVICSCGIIKQLAVWNDRPFVGDFKNEMMRDEIALKILPHVMGKQKPTFDSFYSRAIADTRAAYLYADKMLSARVEK